jgi:hypothetical protein
MGLGISDHKAFTSVSKMYALANVWMESGMGWGYAMKNIWRTYHNIRNKLQTMKIDIPKPQTWG